MSLRAENLTVIGRLANVSCSLERGGITAICGPNGAGKSTLLMALAGLLSADTGRAMLGEERLVSLHLKQRARRIGYLPQSADIAWDVTVRSIVELGRMPHGDSAREPVDTAIAALDLEAFEGRRALTLSGGERARMLLARVLAGEPEWILADEPLAALDIAHQLTLLAHLRRQADGGSGVVIVLHDLALARNHADRVIVLDEGRVAADDIPQRALSEEVIAKVWGVAARWIGEPGAQALVSDLSV
ncbi:ABC transporter ATP-binding protein [Qipengyuania atrilutea]|uniref:ABC transporter ATP-binding protein n=1 Tax=Qipengyuania atrilutea TaxID=2744473 RepID=A0A850H0A2_9SPHN|nr:ABC transporter ATP-binding protein [Actirhodobacter atriluteus]NVD44067.1 ABC transporter ATP-binding protein [Actirhodobacter atriluteus]